MPERALLTGWGRTAASAAHVMPVDVRDVPQAVIGAGERGVLARGLGRSYGDAAQNAGGHVLLLDPDGRVEIDAEAAEVRVDAGVSIDRLIRELLPHGLFPPVTPGTRFVTVGGAVASDVHGKNHHVDGSLGHHLRWIRLVDGQGRERLLTPAESPDEFWATVGGMGLTGVVVAVSMRVRRVETAYIAADIERLANLDVALSRMRETDTSTYSVAWIDLLARGQALGRSVLMRGEHATRPELNGKALQRPLAPPGDPSLRVPISPRLGLVTPASVRAFNELYFRRAARTETRVVQPLGSFFHPLDGVADWNRLYGRRGFTQWQMVVPLGAEAALRDVVRRLSGSGHPSFLAVLKRMGPGNPGLLSFPREGWTLAMDLPMRAGVGSLLDELDRTVMDAGGRIYLAKDSRATPQTIRAMYPTVDEFRRVRARLDPANLFRSDLARRLEL